MATHERELTEPVLLCTPDGRRLDPAATGWSRTPLHTANLRGGWGRTKRWDYWAVLSADVALAVTYADVDYLGMATVWWCDLRTGLTGGVERSLPLARGVALPDRPGSAPLRFVDDHLTLDLVDDPAGTTITAAWTEPGGLAASLDLRIDQPAGHESLNVVIPWSDRRFQYTSKHQARPAHGTLALGDEVHAIGGATPEDEAWGVLDVGRGRWPYATRWNWGGGAGRATDGETVVGIQVGAKWTEGTGATENGVIVDGRLTKVGDELAWTYRWDEPLGPWRVAHPDGSLDLVLRPVHDRHTRVNALVLATEVHQVFGTWSGHVTTDDGRRVEVRAIPGFAEESRSRW
ncbi:DUF2804 domain-containing protein [Aquihabitans sp. G128]|uniref:DUF2804 domain-containing protein n=1 Tax=Aquihabitans sp. G128 TaxID=2849779 RepID=UPI001C22516D|nr:DUF2804 domain-containing protein [Aquihabitans sp. G128]QXC63289.1 DUF2804 domain-containing protein [Aquihabitans sp. G128]